MEKILAAYRKASKQWSATMNKLAQGKGQFCILSIFLLFLFCVLLNLSVLLYTVRQRGRKRTMVG